MNINNHQIDTATSLEETARHRRREERYDSALEYYGRALRIRKGIMDANDLTIADILINMSQVYQLQKQLDMSILMSKQALATMNGHRIRNDENEVCRMFNCIGAIFCDSGKYELAIDCYRRQLKALRSSGKGVESLIIVALTNIAGVHRMRQEYDKAIEVYKQILLEERKVHGRKRTPVSETIKQIAQLYFEKKDYSTAISIYKEVIKIQKHECYNMSNAEIYESIGMAYLKKGNFQLAVSNFLESKKIKESVLGENDDSVALILYKIATAYFMKGDEEQSIFYYRQNLKVLRVLHGDEHMDITLTLKRLGAAQRQRGSLSDALESFERALRIEKKILGDDHVSVAKTLNLIGNIHLQRAQVGEAKSAFATASRILGRRGMRVEHVKLDSLKFYELSLLHPEAAAVA